MILGEQAIGSVGQLWRYPVKSMAGESLDRVFVGHGGLYGDRIYALVQPGGREAFPWLTARERPAMLLHRAVFAHSERTLQPPNWAAAGSGGMTPLFGDADDLRLHVHPPKGGQVDLDDPDVVEQLRKSIPELPEVVLRRSERALTDCGPVSLIDSNFIQEVSARLGVAVDERSFRANILLDCGQGVRLDALVGGQLRIGDEAVVLLIERQGRCVLLTLDPDGDAAHPELLRDVARNNDGTAGVLAVVVREGVVRAGDAVVLMS